MKKLITFMLLCSMTLAGCGASGGKKNDYFGTSNALLKDLTGPASGTATLDIDESYMLVGEVKDIAENDYKDFVSKIKEAGFNVDTSDGDYYFRGYNKDYRKISLDYHTYDNSMDIEIEQLDEYSNGYNSLYDEINGDYPKRKELPSDATGVRDEIKTKVDENKEATDKVLDELEKMASDKTILISESRQNDYQNTYKKLWYFAPRIANISNVYELTYDEEEYVEGLVQEMQNRVESIDETLNKLYDDEYNSDISTDSSNDSTSSTSSSEVSADFKAVMDKYEAFFNEYVEFMKKYNANPTDAELLSSYSDYTQKYFDYMDELKNYGSDSDLSSADLAYYAEVNARISQKLLEISQ